MDSKEAILLIDDNYYDVMIVKDAFNELKIVNPLIIAKNGEQALTLLRHSANRRTIHKHVDRKLPGLILLDLHLSSISGIEVLRQIKKDKFLKYIPVVVLTTSKRLEDRKHCFELGVAGYVEKALTYSQFLLDFKIIYEYWSLCESSYF